MLNRRKLPVNLTVLTLAAVLWQAQANAQAGEKKEEDLNQRGQRGVGNRGLKRTAGVRKRRHPGVRRLSRLRERARMYEPLIAEAARKHGVDPRVLWTIAFLETRFRPELVSPKNARGMMQFIPATAKRFRLTNPHDAAQSIDAAARYVNEIVGQFGGRLDLVLASYNAGENAVDCYLKGRTQRTSAGKLINPRGLKTSGVPPYRETVQYVKRGMLVFSRVSEAGVFTPEIIARTRRLQAPAMTIGLSDQKVIDGELRELSGVSPALLYSGTREIAVGEREPNKLAVLDRARSEEGNGAGIETVFFDVHSGVRYLVSNGKIVKPVENSEGADRGLNSTEGEVVRHVVTKSFYAAGGE